MDENALIKGSEAPASQLTLQTRELAQRLRYMVVNGNKLADQEIFALAHYATGNGLNPFMQECYYIPGKGPTPGIAGWRRKAQEQIQYEAELAKVPGAHYWVEFVQATGEDCKFEPSRGDIAFVAILRDSLTQQRWRKEVLDVAAQMVKDSDGSINYSDALKEARSLIGKEPVTLGAGVVFGGENFGTNDKFDRIERAKKRAEKLVLRKRFPRLHLPEVEGAEDVDTSDYKIVMEPPPPLGPEGAKRVIKELGFEGEPEKPSNAPYEEGEIIDHAEPEPIAPESVKVSATRPYDPEYLRTRIVNGALKYKNEGAKLKPLDRQVIVASMTNLFAGIEDARNYGLKVLKYLTGTDDQSIIDDEWLIAIRGWLKVHDNDGDPMPDAMACEEAMKIIECMEA